MSSLTPSGSFSNPCSPPIHPSADGGKTTAPSSPASCFANAPVPPWRDLPERFGNWKTIYQRKRHWALDGTWNRIAERLRLDADIPDGPDWTLSIDSTVVRAHQHAAGARHHLPVDHPKP